MGGLALTCGSFGWHSERPYTFIVLGLLILILGPLAILRTPTDVFPTIDIPVVSIIWNYTGLAPEEMANRIVSVTERIAHHHRRRHPAHRVAVAARRRRGQDGQSPGFAGRRARGEGGAGGSGPEAGRTVRGTVPTTLALLVFGVGCAGCAVGPDYSRPATPSRGVQGNAAGVEAGAPADDVRAAPGGSCSGIRR